MGHYRIFLAACLTLALLGSATEGLCRDSAPRGTKTAPAKKGSSSFIAKPIEPQAPREEKPRAGWNGFYGGLNSGAATDR